MRVGDAWYIYTRWANANCSCFVILGVLYDSNYIIILSREKISMSTTTGLRNIVCRLCVSLILNDVQNYCCIDKDHGVSCIWFTASKDHMYIGSITVSRCPRVEYRMLIMH